MCIYLYQSMQGSYNLMYEKLVIFLVLSVLGMGVLFAFLQHLQAWRRQIWSKVFEPCLKGTTLMGTKKNITFEFDLENSENDRDSHKMTKSSFKGFSLQRQGEQ